MNLLRPLPERFAGVGVLVLGLAWGLGSALAGWDQVRAAEVPLAGALSAIVLGGTLTAAGVWLGAGAVAWAMGRLLGGRARFLKVLFTVSAAAPPLWFGAPCLAALTALDLPTALVMLLGAVCAAAAVAFLFVFVSGLRAVEEFTLNRAWGCAALTVVFCTSLISLQ